MQADRRKHLGVDPYESSPERQGYANSFKQKIFKTRLGEITFDIHRVREDSFYPDALEKGVYSERASKMTLDEMDIPGVSTRRAKIIILRLISTSISSSRVSQAAAQLDKILEA